MENHFFASAKEYVKTGWEHAAARQGTKKENGVVILCLVHTNLRILIIYYMFN
jgi:hypothetical protein